MRGVKSVCSTFALRCPSRYRTGADQQVAVDVCACDPRLREEPLEALDASLPGAGDSDGQPRRCRYERTLESEDRLAHRPAPVAPGKYLRHGTRCAAHR